MNIFISWSGQKSKLVAELFRSWLPLVIQAVKPWLSSKDIDRGSIWFSEINNQLADTNNGIVCLTKSNINKPWILFESGALAKGLTHNRVFTYLIDIEPKDVRDPLAQFNHTTPTKEGLLQLVRSINKGLAANVLSEQILHDTFEKFYPDFEKKINQIIDSPEEEEEIKELNQDDYMDEILFTVRAIDQRVRKLEDTNDQLPKNYTSRALKYWTFTGLKDASNISISDLDLSVRAFNTLKSYRVDTVSDLLSFNVEFIENERIKKEVIKMIEECKRRYEKEE